MKNWLTQTRTRKQGAMRGLASVLAWGALVASESLYPPGQLNNVYELDGASFDAMVPRGIDAAVSSSARTR